MKALPVLSLLLGFSGLVSAQTHALYETAVAGQNPTAWFKLDGSVSDTVTPSQSLTAFGGAFTTDAFRAPTNAFAFHLSGDALQFAGDLIGGGGAATNAAAGNGKGSISLIFRTLDFSTNSGQRYIFCQTTAADGNATTNGNALGLYFEQTNATSGPGDLRLRVGDTNVSILASNQIAFDQWYYFAMTYDETRDAGEVIWYLGRVGGPLASNVMDIGNSAVAGDDGPLTLGNRTGASSAFVGPGNGRIEEFALWNNRELSGVEVAAQFSKLPNYLPAGDDYETLITAQAPTHYYKLDNSLADSVGTGPTLTLNGSTGAFTNDLLGVPNYAYSFNSSTDALIAASDLISGGGSEAGDSTATGVGTISLIFRSLPGWTTNGQRFLLSQGSVASGSAGTNDGLALYLENGTAATDPCALRLRGGNTSITLITSNLLAFDTWYYFAMTYDESRDSQNGGEVHWYIGPVGGTLATGPFNPANIAVIGNNGFVYLGNRDYDLNGSGFRGPGYGIMDDFATWNEELSTDEIRAQFVAATPRPTLNITPAGSSVVLAWSTNLTANYLLEATNSISGSPLSAWPSAGSAVIFGSQYVVTNAATGQTFYRLRRPL